MTLLETGPKARVFWVARDDFRRVGGIFGGYKVEFELLIDRWVGLTEGALLNATWRDDDSIFRLASPVGRETALSLAFLLCTSHLYPEVLGTNV